MIMPASGERPSCGDAPPRFDNDGATKHRDRKVGSRIPSLSEVHASTYAVAFVCVD